MKRTISFVFLAGIVIGSVMLLVLALDSTVACAGGKNHLNFDNQSGTDAVVRVFGQASNKRVAGVKVPDKQNRGTRIANGHYYIVGRFGPIDGKEAKEKKHRYAKGDPFSIQPPTGKYSKVTITLHGVVDGNYRTAPSDEKEFEK